MPLIDPLIVALCFNTAAPIENGKYNEACNKAVDAYTRQVGVRQDSDNLESKTIEYVDEKAEKKLGKAGKILVGSTIILYKTAKDKKLVLKIPEPGFCNSIENEATKDSYQVKFKWSIK